MEEISCCRTQMNRCNEMYTNFRHYAFKKLHVTSIWKFFCIGLDIPTATIPSTGCSRSKRTNTAVLRHWKLEFNIYLLIMGNLMTVFWIQVKTWKCHLQIMGRSFCKGISHVYSRYANICIMQYIAVYYIHLYTIIYIHTFTYIYNMYIHIWLHMYIIVYV